MGFLTWIFLPQKKWHLSKLNILDFLPAMQMNWNFSLANFSRVDGMLFSIHFIFMFLCDNEKKHSVNLNHGKCKSQTNTLSAMSEKQTDKWKHSNVLCTCTNNVPLWILSTTYFMYVSDGNFASNSMYLDVSCTTCLYEKVRNFYPSYASLGWAAVIEITFT